MSPLLIAGGAVLALYLLSQSGGSSSEIKEAVILDGVDGESDEYNLTIDAMTAKVSPFDKKSMFVFYNNSESASDPALQRSRIQGHRSRLRPRLGLPGDPHLQRRRDGRGVRRRQLGRCRGFRGRDERGQGRGDWRHRRRRR